MKRNRDQNPTLFYADDKNCDRCDAKATERTCGTCGVAALITDCGHQSQPRPIATDERGRDICESCFES